MARPDVILVTCAILCVRTIFCADSEDSYKFDFGAGPVGAGYVQVLPTSAYSDDIGFGFEPSADVAAQVKGGDSLLGDFITSPKPYYFSLKVPEGNYQETDRV